MATAATVTRTKSTTVKLPVNYDIIEQPTT
jgi:hypothetical protein